MAGQEKRAQSKRREQQKKLERGRERERASEMEEEKKWTKAADDGFFFVRPRDLAH